LPHESIVHVVVLSDYYNIDSIIGIEVDEKESIVQVVKARCRTHVDYYRTPRTFEDGGLEVFVKSLEMFTTDIILGNIANMFFGEEWDVLIGQGDGVVDVKMVDRVKYFRDLISVHDTGPWNKTIGIYDMTHEVRAATKIQAMFRGWKARKEFRFDPETTLGRFYIARMFEELLEL
jgi:hypothetical protein